MQGKSEPSPLTRGTRIFGFQSCLNIRFIPAYAGNSPAENGSPRRDSVHPRLRGELTAAPLCHHFPCGSSPLTRGTRIFKRNGRSTQRFIPAYAGNSRSFGRYSDFRSVHPRLRGELCFLICFSVGQRGSSPLTRGTPACKRSITLVKRFIPAYAGNSVEETDDHLDQAVHPRLRGELVQRTTTKCVRFGSSPLTRGTLIKEHAVLAHGRFIPAYAGNSLMLLIMVMVLLVHPRLRGELYPSNQPMPFKYGSSPLTRGTHY